MANIVILTNTSEYPYHTVIVPTIQSALQVYNHTVSILDIDSYPYDHQCHTQLKQMNPDALITLDLAGFRFRTQSRENALNLLSSKNLNLIWGNKPEYEPLLNKKISLSMLFYDASGSDYNLSQLYPNLLYYKALAPIMCSPTVESDRSLNQTNFTRIWKDFAEEVLLFET